MTIYTPAQRRYLSSLDPRDPDYLGPDDEDEAEESMDDEDDGDHYNDGYGQDCIHFDNPADDYGSDNPADDYIMTERELRGEL